MLVIVSQWMAIQRETSWINVANPCVYLWYCKLNKNNTLVNDWHTIVYSIDIKKSSGGAADAASCG